MTPAQIDNCIAFLQRTNLTGAEVGAYVEVVKGLQALKSAINDGLRHAAAAQVDDSGGKQTKPSGSKRTPAAR